MKIVLATKNPGKLKELLELAGGAPWLDLVLAPAEFDPEETGSTFLENATIKASAAARLTGLTAVADDSGLVVEALNGRPGIHSARYCEGDDKARRKKLLAELKDVPAGQRQAAFICNMAVANPDGRVVQTAEGVWPGEIGFVERGENGFGYDPIFCLPGRDMTAAELPPSEKNVLSHRGQAWRAVLSYLQSLAVELSKNGK